MVKLLNSVYAKWSIKIERVENFQLKNQCRYKIKEQDKMNTRIYNIYYPPKL